MIPKIELKNIIIKTMIPKIEKSFPLVCRACQVKTIDIQHIAI